MVQIKELELIKAVKKTFDQKDTNLLLGIGDDCAALHVSPGHELLVTTDTLVENVHFKNNQTTPRLLGRKSAAVNLSDIAAMGGHPKYLLLSLCVTSKVDKKWINAFLLGFKEEIETFDCFLIGGNVSSARREISIGVTALGEIKRGRKVLRSCAAPGDYLFVTGTPGDSALGFDLLASGKKSFSKNERKLIRRHRSPTPRVKWGEIISSNRLASAMIDISDGVALDLDRICEASNVSAEIDLATFPLSKEAINISEKKGAIPWRRILTGGEDYELLFTVRSAKLKAVKRVIDSGELNAFKIGVITQETGKSSSHRLKIIKASGEALKLENRGWRHDA